MPRRLLLAAVALLGAIALGAAVAAALLLAVSAGWQRERVRAALESTLAERLDAQVRVGALTGPLYPELGARDVEVRRADGARIEAAALELRWRPVGLPFAPRVAIERLRVEGARIELDLDAVSVDRGGDGTGAAAPPVASVRRIELPAARFDVRWTQRGRPSRVAGTVDLEGAGLSLDTWPERVSGRIELEPSQVEGLALHAAQLGLELTDSHLVLDRAELESEFGAASAAGRADLAGWLDPAASASAELSARLDAVDPGVLTGRDRLAGRVTGTLEARAERAAGAPLEASAFQIQATATSSTLGPIEVTGLDLAGRYAAGSWEIERAELRGNVGTVAARGSGTLDAIGSLDLSAEGVDLARLPAAPAGLPELAGRARVRAQLSGPWREPRGRAALDVVALRIAGEDVGALHAEVSSPGGGRLEFRRLAIEGPQLTLANDGPAVVRVERGGLAVERLRLTSAGQALDLSGRIEPGAVRGIEIDARELELAPLAALAGIPGRAGGRLTARLRADGRLPLPALVGSGTWQAPRYGALSAERIRFDAEASGGRLRARVEVAGLGPGPLTADAELPYDPAHFDWNDLLRASGVRLALHTDGLDLDRLGPLRHEAVTGRVSGRVELLGARPLPRARGRLRLEGARLELAGVEPLQVGAELEIEGWAAQVESLELEHAGIRQVLTGRVELTPGAERIDVAADLRGSRGETLALAAMLPRDAAPFGPAPLLSRDDARLELRARGLQVAWLAPLLPAGLRTASGSIEADARVRGGAGGPVLSGDMALFEGGADLPVLGQRLTPISGRIRFAGDRLQIDALRGGAPGAGAELRGEVVLGSAASADLELTLDGLPLERPGTIRASLHGRVSLEGPLAAPRLEGAIELADARVLLPEPQDRLLREVRVLGLPDDATRIGEDRAAGIWDNAAVDLRVVVPRNTWVQGRGATLELEGELRAARESGAELRYFGTLRALRGTYRLHGRPFDIEQAVAAFPGSAALDPQLHVVAVYRIRDVVITAIIGGWYSEPEIELSSSPPMSEEDRLAYLVFGRPAAELGGGQALDVTATAQALAGKLAVEELSGILRRRLPVDTLDVRLGAAGEGPSVAVGRYLGDEVFVEYGQSLGAEGGEELRIEWRLSPEWSVESEVSTRASSGADLIWTLDY